MCVLPVERVSCFSAEQAKRCPGEGRRREAEGPVAMDPSGKTVMPKRRGLIQVPGLLILQCLSLTSMLSTRANKYTRERNRFLSSKGYLASFKRC